MPIYPARIYSARPRRGDSASGFTLIELLLVMGLLSLTLVLVTPTFFSMFKGDRDREMSRLVRVMRMARNEAILTGRRHRIWFDLKAHRYEFEQEIDGAFVAYERPRIMRAHALPTALRMVDVIIVGEGSERIRDQRVPIIIDNSGYMDPFMLHVREGQEIITVRSNGLAGRFEVLPGDVTDLRN